MKKYEKQILIGISVVMGILCVAIIVILGINIATGAKTDPILPKSNVNINTNVNITNTQVTTQNQMTTTNQTTNQVMTNEVTTNQVTTNTASGTSDIETDSADWAQQSPEKAR